MNTRTVIARIDDAGTTWARDLPASFDIVGSGSRISEGAKNVRSETRLVTWAAKTLRSLLTAS